MATIEIKDLPQEMKISRQEMQRIMGGARWNPPAPWLRSPWLIGAIVTTAIAVPLSPGSNDDDQP